MNVKTLLVWSLSLVLAVILLVDYLTNAEQDTELDNEQETESPDSRLTQPYNTTNRTHPHHRRLSNKSGYWHSDYNVDNR